jgi:hypothetical protein
LGLTYFDNKCDENLIGFGVGSSVDKNAMGIYLIRLFGIPSFFGFYLFCLD